MLGYGLKARHRLLKFLKRPNAARLTSDKPLLPRSKPVMLVTLAKNWSVEIAVMLLKEKLRKMMLSESSGMKERFP